MEKLREPVGKQDQYISAYGGITCFEFLPDGRVQASPLNVSEETLLDWKIICCCSLQAMRAQPQKSCRNNMIKARNLTKRCWRTCIFVKELGRQSQRAWKAIIFANSRADGRSLAAEKGRSAIMSNEFINDSYDVAMANGALGGKLIGAGGGGFLMFYAEDKARCVMRCARED
jgi:Predicted kinase related to galactokinase and mevalonate kinase